MTTVKNNARVEEGSKKRKRGAEDFFFFNDTATTEIYTLSLHDALPISLIVVEALVDFTGMHSRYLL